MDKVYQVFVSSTFSDLEEERKKISDTLAKAGFIPAGMELFPATSFQQLKFIKKVIDRCDYYVVVVGARYGSLDGDKSFTEKEYEYALSKNIPVLAFIHKSPGKIAAEKTETDPAQTARLESFRTRLKASQIVQFWTDINDLCVSVLTAVTSEVTLSPGIGWVRGDQAIDLKLLQDMERLRSENAELLLRLSEFDNTDIVFPADIAGPESQIEIKYYEGYRNPDVATAKHKFQATLKDIFLKAIDGILGEKRETETMDNVAKSYFPDAEKHRFKTLYVDIDDIRTVRIQLEALGLINAISQSQIYDGKTISFIAWTMTSKGRKYMARNLARASA